MSYVYMTVMGEKLKKNHVKIMYIEDTFIKRDKV